MTLRRAAHLWTAAACARPVLLTLALAITAAGCRETGPIAADAVKLKSAPLISSYSDQAAAMGVAFEYDHGGSGRYYYTEVLGGGGALFDYDGDGFLDIYLTQGAALPGYKPATPLRNRLYRNVNGERFEDVTDQAGVDGVSAGGKHYSIGCTAADADNDGDVDLLVTGFGGCIFYRNNGDGTFTDVTSTAGIDADGFGSSAIFVDYDSDGLLDLLICQYVDYKLGHDIQCADANRKLDYCQPGFFPPSRSRLYRNLGGLRFADVTDSAGLDSTYDKGLGAVACDVDGDGDQDIYITCDLTPNLLYINQGDGRFVEEATARGCALSEDAQPQAGMGVDLRDVDGDLLPDIAVTNYWAEPNNLYRNLGEGFFTDVASAVGLAEPSRPWVGFGTALRDLNNDGWLDQFVVNGHVVEHPEGTTPGTGRRQAPQLYLNEGGGNFSDVSSKAGSAFTQKSVGRGAAFGDWDNDGDIDILLTPNGGPVSLLRNENGDRNQWIGFKLQGRKSNRDGLGSSIVVDAGGRQRRDEVRTGYSYLCASDPRLIFGLGAETRIEGAEVRWPSGAVDRLPSLEAGRYYTVVEGEGVLRASTNP